MKEKHYKKELSAFLNHELSPEERQTVGEHLLHCQICRSEHEEIKFAVILAQNLKRADAPTGVWNGIEAELNGKTSRKAAVSIFNFRNLAFASVLLILISGFSAIFYLNLSRTEETVENSPKNTPQIFQPEKTAGWQVESIEGAPKILNSSKPELLEVGEILETDENSRAKIDVADIGQVEIAPNSLVKLVNSSETEHRMALEYGSLEAMIFAPPRLFVVDTPTAAAVDLGCAYKLEVDKAGNSKLHVTSGYVALERDGRESIVPAGAMCLTRRGKGLGTPFLETASTEFKDALKKFDFENGGSAALEKILRKARSQDTLSLWHLLSRVSGKEREQVFQKIASFSKLPESVTREGILNLDKQMLEDWRYELEMLWFE
ncbi:MAG TPA: FecR domain-containing protein [Pyrinomonadaceae bacterium]|nr:FecR domain-containing protein [Pyrinomonadaceae bacterium]